jgi:NAD(P)-dependent dehydrogenase (short-subunit alcohol dehydrogenase family)
MTDHKVGTREEWLAAREKLLLHEKEHTRLGDEIAQQRRERPWVPVEKEYRFDTDEGEKTLAEAAEVDALDEQAVDDHLRSVTDRAGRVDISFNAIGIANPKIRVPLVELDVEQFSLPITTYTRSYFLTARLAARRMVVNGSGVIMTVTSTPSRTGKRRSGDGRGRGTDSGSVWVSIREMGVGSPEASGGAPRPRQTDSLAPVSHAGPDAARGTHRRSRSNRVCATERLRRTIRCRRPREVWHK